MSMIYPAATWRPGSHAGYTYGKTQMVSAVAHYTVGRDSTGPGVSGLFQFLIRRDGEIVQFAEADALCYHAGQPYNSRGPGIEIEFLPDQDPSVFTPESLAACAALVSWLETLGIPAEYHDDPTDKRADWRGFISHRSVVSDADTHYDYWPQEDWDAMTGGDMSLSEADFDRINLIVLGHILDLAGGANLDGTLVSTRLLEQKIEAIPAGGGGGGLTEDQVRAVVRAELDKTKLGH